MMILFDPWIHFPSIMHDSAESSPVSRACDHITCEIFYLDAPCLLKKHVAVLATRKITDK